MANKLSSKAKSAQREALSIIDAIKSILKELGNGGSLNDDLDLSNINAQLSFNPTDLLLKIITKFVSYDDLIKQLSKYIVYELPVIELAVKGILLANLKATIDCTNDPRIPEKYRMALNTPTYSTLSDESAEDSARGIAVTVGAIDCNNLLSYSPMSKIGRTKYFGTQLSYTVQSSDENGDEETFDSYEEAFKYAEEQGLERGAIVKHSDVDTVYELARAKDFNAFLWFVIHKGKFPNSRNVAVDDETFESQLPGSKESILNAFTVEGIVNPSGATNNKKLFLAGNTIVESYDNCKSTILSLCFKTEESVDEDIAAGLSDIEYEMMEKYMIYHFYPLSSDYHSANWYVNRNNYYNFIYESYVKADKIKPRDYTKEFAICNIRYEDRSSSSYGYYVNSQNKLRLKILPKPLWHVPNRITMSSDEDGSGKTLNFHVKRILFDQQGVGSSKGKYTIQVANILPTYDEDRKLYYYEVLNNEGENATLEGNQIYAIVDVHGEYFLSISKEVDSYLDAVNNQKVVALNDFNDGAVSYENVCKILPCILHECYPGLTVYEFNYDFIMGMRLFDAKVVATQLIQALSHVSMNGGMNLGFSISKTESEYQMRISSIVEKMLEEDTSEVSDCFFTFSNEEYDEQLQESELKRSNLYSFNDSVNKAATVDMTSVNSILNEYNDNASKEENRDVISRAIDQAAVSITDEVLPEDKYNIKFNFVVNMFKVFITILVETLLSPKIMLILEVNRRMIGDYSEPLKFEDVLKALIGVITAIVRELRDMILQYLLEWVMKILTELFEAIIQYVVVEQIQYYKEILLWLIQNCIPSWGRANLATTLDNVNYADIDEVDSPKTDEC